MPHRSWWVPQKNRAVDKIGVAVAVAFLVAIGLMAGGRGDKVGEKRLSSDVPVHVDTLQAARASLEDEGPTTDPRMTSLREDVEGFRRPSAQKPVEDRLTR